MKLFSKITILFFFIICAFTITSSAHAATRTWDGGGGADTNWSTATNWSLDTVPVAADTVVFDNTSDNNSTIDAGFAGTITTLNINSGYDGTITSGTSLIVTGSFTQAAGNFVAPSAMTISSTFTLSGGTFNANSGTLTFIGGTATISCNNATFNLVVLSHTSGTKTISSNCNLPLGNNPSIAVTAGSVILQGTLSGSGTLTTISTFTSSSTNPLSGFSALSSSNFTQTAGTFTAPATMTVSSVFTLSNGTFIAPLNMTANGTFTVTGGTYNHNNGTITFTGTTATISCNNVTFNLVAFNVTGNKTISSNCTLPLGNNPTVGPSGNMTLIGTLSGTGTLTTVGVLTASSTNPLSGFSAISASSLTVSAGTFPTLTTVSITSNFSQSGGTFNAPTGMSVGQAYTLSGGIFNAPANMSVSTTFTISGGTFNHNNGTLTFTGSTATLSCNNTTFYLVVFSNSSTKTINDTCSFPLGDNPVISSSVLLKGTLSGSGTLTTSGTFTASSTNPLSGFSALSSSAFAITAGAFTAPATTTVVSTFTMSGGTLDASTNLTINSGFTISGGTFNHNNGTLTFTGSTATLSCNNTTFNVVIFSNTGTKTVLENCSFPLGNNPTTSTGAITLRGTLSGTGTLIMPSTLTASSTNPLSGFDALTTGTFILSAGTFTAPANMSVGGTFTISGGTFTHNNGTVTFTSTSAITCSNATFHHVVLAHTGGIKIIPSDCSFPLGNNPTLGSSSVTVDGTLSGTGVLNTYVNFSVRSAGILGFTGLIANKGGGGTGGDLSISGGTLDASNYTILDLAGDFTILNDGVFTAPPLMNIGSDWELRSGTFNHNNGTVVFDSENSNDIIGSSVFYNLSKNSTLASAITFSSASTTTITNNLNLSGASGNLLSLESSDPGTQWSIDSQGTSNLSYLDVQDSNAITALTTSGIDSGNNTNWTITAIPAVSTGGSSRSGSVGSYAPQYVAQIPSPVIPSIQACRAGDLFNALTGAPCKASNGSTVQVISSVWLFTRDLQFGITHPEVRLLQQFLNQNGFMVSTTGAGSSGSESDYFGNLTRQALIKFQNGKGIKPAAGYFGPITRAFIAK